MGIDYRIFEEITLARSGNYILYMEDRDKRHAAHVHLREGTTPIVSINLKSGEEFAGKIPRKIRRYVVEWINERKERLLIDWETIRGGNKPQEIYDDFDP
jgi:hypothetical protein